MKWLWPRRQDLEEIEITIAVRLGRFLHWTALAFVGVMWLGEFAGAAFGYWSSNSFVVGLSILAGIAIVIVGRGLRYVFANE